MRGKNIHWQSVLSAILLMVLAYILYANTFGNAWLMDDFPVVVDNPDIRSIRAFLENSYPGRPLREITYLPEYALFGLNPAGYHIQNIFWHGLNAVLVYLLVLRLNGPKLVAWTSALFFLAHPVQVEVVANISHRKDSLALAFSLISLLAYMRIFQPGARRLLWAFFSLISLYLGYLAKQNVLVVPLVFVVYECGFVSASQRILLRNVKLAWAGLVAGAVALVSWLVHIWGDEGFRQTIVEAMAKMADVKGATLASYYAMVMKSLAFGFSKLLFPVRLSMEYVYPFPSSWGDAWVVSALAGLAGMTILLLVARKRSPIAFFALFWMLVLWLPTSNLFTHLSYFAADRYMYAPSVGFCIVSAVAIDRCLNSWPAGRWLAAAAIIAIFALLTWRQNRFWNNPLTFYSHMLEVSPQSKEGLLGIANWYRESGETEKALEILQNARIRHFRDPRIYRDIGLIYVKKGEKREAISYFQKAIAVDPAYAPAYKNLGSVYDDIGERAMAMEAITKAISLAPHDAAAYTSLGIVYLHSGRPAEAEKMLRTAIRELPGYGDAHYNLGVLLYEKGEKGEAVNAFRRAVQLSPENAEALFNLAAVSLEVGDIHGGASLLPALKKLNPRFGDELQKLVNEKEMMQRSMK